MRSGPPCLLASPWCQGRIGDHPQDGTSQSKTPQAKSPCASMKLWVYWISQADSCAVRSTSSVDRAAHTDTAAAVCALMGRLGIPRHQGTVGSAWMGRSPFAGRYGQHPAFAVRPAYPEREFPTPVESRRPFPGLGGRSEGTRGDGKPMPEAGSLAAFYGLALLDCINPSAMLVTLYLLQRSKPVRTVTAY